MLMAINSISIIKNAIDMAYMSIKNPLLMLSDNSKQAKIYHT
jgi:hypothetical protein